ncbi:hypothetical protein BDF21DRAFT_397479 [Thamnidium elegans]|nr:hypothetical protein BDF21DRAFT_397479 [Thamnidium elegans]
MKSNIIYLLLVILFSLSVVVCQQDFYTCKRVCEEDFITRIDALNDNENRTPADFEAILPYWTTCQYRCHRCYLVGAIKRMNMIQTMFDDDQYHGTRGYTIISKCFDAIRHDLQWTCYNPWLFAIRDNDRNRTQEEVRILKFIKLLADAQQDLEICRVACNINFRPKLVSIIPRERVYADFEALIPHWQTCQYRCYRCHLTGMTQAMEKLKTMFLGSEKNEQHAIVGITRILNSIDTSFEDTCYQRWIIANRLNDTASTFG